MQFSSLCFSSLYQSSDRNHTTKDVETVIAFLNEHQAPQRALAISQACGYNTKKSINPTLYQMLKDGLIEQVLSKPLTWKLTRKDKLYSDSYFGSAVSPRSDDNRANYCSGDSDSEGFNHKPSQSSNTSVKASGSSEDLKGDIASTGSNDTSSTMHGFINDRPPYKANPPMGQRGPGLLGPAPPGLLPFPGAQMTGGGFVMNGRGHPFNGPAGFSGMGFGRSGIPMSHPPGPGNSQPLGRARGLIQAAFGYEGHMPGKGQRPVPVLTSQGSWRGRGPKRGLGRGNFNPPCPGQEETKGLYIGTKDVHQDKVNGISDVGSNRTTTSSQDRRTSKRPEDRGHKDAFRKSLHDKTAPGAYVPKVSFSDSVKCCRFTSTLPQNYIVLSPSLSYMT